LSDRFMIEIKEEADLFILEYKLNKHLQKYFPDIVSSAVVVLVAKELATNILKYGGAGFVSLEREGNKLKLIAEDEGKENLDHMAKGAKKGLGLGLSVARRNCDYIEIKRKVDGGTLVEAVFSQSRHSNDKMLLDIGIATRPHYLEEENGDVCFFKELNGKYLLFVGDVLGHGHKAGIVAEKIKAYLAECDYDNLQSIYYGLEDRLGNDRGCAAFLGFLSKNLLEYVNIGNIKGWIINAFSVRSLSNQSGIVGRMTVNVKTFTEVLPAGFVLMVCTDGIKRRFSQPNDIKALKNMNASKVARKIMEEYGIKNDDASVFVAMDRGMKF